MERSKKSRAGWWLLFFASTAVLVAGIFFHWEYLTLSLPFVCTSFVYAMDIV